MALTSSRDAAPVGRQRPRLECYPLYRSSAGQDAIDVAALAGIDLDDWQRYVLERALGEGHRGRWAAFEVGLVVPRQNGKNIVLEARELAGALLFGERRIIHTAHRYDAAMDAFEKLVARLRAHPDLMEYVWGYQGDPEAERVSGFRTSHGFESVRFVNGATIAYKTRTPEMGRSFSVDGLIVLDEAYALTGQQIGSLLPTLAAQTVIGNPQIWYTSSAGKRASDVLEALRDRGTAGQDERLAYFEWSCDETAEGFDEGSEECWAQANPSYGIRISAEYVRSEREALRADPEQFRRERLGVWAPPDTDPPVISPEAWAACADPEARRGPGRIFFGVDVPPSRESAVVVAASELEDGRVHVVVVDQGAGVAWVGQRLRDLLDAHPGSRVVVDAGGAASALQAELRRYRVSPVLVRMREYAQACGLFFDAVEARQVVHIGQEQLDAAVAGARIRPLGESLWAWRRRSALADISPLVGASLALLGVRRSPSPSTRPSGPRGVVVGG